MATKLFLSTRTSDLSLVTVNNVLDFTSGTGLTSVSTNTVTGPTAGVAINGSRAWWTAPLSAVTISGTLTLNIWGLENNMSANVGFQVLVERTNNAGTVLSTISNTEQGVELGTVATVQNWTVTPTSTTLATGDRIKVTLFGNDVGTMATGFTFTTSWGQTVAATNGDTWIQTTEAIVAPIIAAAGGGNWSATGTWVGGVVPTAANDVALISTSGNVTIDTSAAVCRSLDCTGYTGTLTHGAGVTFSIGDATAGAGNKALTLVSGMTYTISSGTVNFVSTSATQQTVTWGTKVPPDVFFNGAGGSWIFNDGYTNTGATFRLTAGTLNLNGKTISVGAFDSNNNNTRTLTMGASSFTVSAFGSAWSISGTGMTFNANTSTINVGGSSPGFSGGAKTYNIVIVTPSGDAYIQDANTFATLTVTGIANKNESISFYASQTVTGTLTINGNSSINRMWVKSGTLGTTQTLTAATVTVTNADFMDITGAGAGSWNLAAITGLSGDCQGNSGITFTTPATQTHTTSAGGNWSDVTKWTSRVPLPQDNVIVNVNTTGTLTVDMPRFGKDQTYTGFAGTMAFSSSFRRLFGSITLASGMTLTTSGSQILAMGRLSTNTVTMTGKTIDYFEIDSLGGKYTLQDAASFGILYHGYGELDTNSVGVTCTTQFQSAGGFTRTFTGGTSTFTLSTTTSITVWNVSAGGLTWAGTNITVVISTAYTGTRTFTGGGQTYGTLTYTVASSPGILAISDFNTFGTINVNSAKIIQFPTAGSTTATTWNINGTLPTNTITNPSFEVDTTGWAADVNCTIARSTVQFKVGIASLELTSTATGDGTVLVGARLLTGASGAPVSSSLLYSFRGFVRSSTATARAYLSMNWYTAGAVFLGSTQSPYYTNINSSGWVQLAYSGITPATAAFGTFFVEFSNASGVTTGDKFYLDDVHLDTGLTVIRSSVEFSSTTALAGVGQPVLQYIQVQSVNASPTTFYADPGGVDAPQGTGTNTGWVFGPIPPTTRSVGACIGSANFPTSGAISFGSGDM